MEFELIAKRAVEIKKKYADLEIKKYGKEWTKEQIFQGFISDVGELSELIMAKEGIRVKENVDEDLAHELSDCLWSIIILANKFNIDLEKSFLNNMDRLEKRIESERTE